MVLLKDQGLIHEITTSVSWAEKDHVLWAATYFGASRYDGRYWKNFLAKDSGLPSNFLNQVKALDGTRAWFATDKGDRKSTRLNSSHLGISYAVFCLKKKTQ